MPRVRLSLGLLLLVGLLLASGLMITQAAPAGRLPVAPAGAAQTTPPTAAPSITVFGEGSATAQPDQAILAVGVEVSRPTATEALTEASQLTQAVLAKLDELGIPRAQVQTTQVGLFPVHEEGPPPSHEPRPGPRGEPKLTGYRAGSLLTVLLTDLTQVGAVLDGVVAAGANRIGGVQFGLRDPNAVRSQALQAAVQTARPRAEVLAAGLRLKPGDVLAISEQGAGSPVPVHAPAATGGAGMPIEGGQLTVRVHVQVTFALVPGP